jgi:hypothetical protein
MGIMIGNRLEDNRDSRCCNIWQPLADPKDESSDPVFANIEYLTGKFIILNSILANLSHV